MADLALDPASCLPDDGTAGTLIGRCWVPGANAGPAVVAVRDDGVFDLSERCADRERPARRGRACAARSRPRAGRRSARWRTSCATAGARGAMPRCRICWRRCDLQVIKAAGVTFATSLLERVIEEQAKGDPARPTACAPRCSRRIGGPTCADIEAGLGRRPPRSRRC